MTITLSHDTHPSSHSPYFTQLAVDDAVTTPMNTQVTLDPKVNDISRSGSPLMIEDVFGGQNGVCVLNQTTNEVTYTPGTDYHGTDVCHYTVCDGNGMCDQAVRKMDIHLL